MISICDWWEDWRVYSWWRPLYECHRLATRVMIRNRRAGDIIFNGCLRKLKVWNRWKRIYVRIRFGDRIVGWGGGSLHSFLLSEQNSWRVNVAGRKYYKRTHLAPKQSPRDFALPPHQQLVHVVQIMIVHEKADKKYLNSNSKFFIFVSIKSIEYHQGTNI